MELTQLMTKLKFQHLPAQLETVCEQAAKQEWDYPAFLTEALRLEWQGRHVNGVDSRLRQARPALGEDPGAVRFRIPAEPGPQTGQDPGRPGLCGAG